MKIFFFLTLMISSLNSFASEEVFMDVKERLRLSLWIEGLTESRVEKPAPVRARLPEELERVLRKDF